MKYQYQQARDQLNKLYQYSHVSHPDLLNLKYLPPVHTLHSSWSLTEWKIFHQPM